MPKAKAKAKHRPSGGRLPSKRRLNATLLTLTASAVSDLAYCYYVVENAECGGNGKTEDGRPTPTVRLARGCINDFEVLLKTIKLAKVREPIEE